MDLFSRGQPNPEVPQHHKKTGFMSRILRVETFTVIVGSALLLAAVALFLGLTNVGSESKKVNDKEYQAIFLNNGQVYFGKIKDLNSKFVDLTKIFYIENNSQNTGTTSAQNTNYTLRKLGTTELHAPEDEMIINRDQITFWENLKDTGQVVQKINEYYKNPSAANGSSSNSTTAPATTAPATTAPATSR